MTARRDHATDLPGPASAVGIPAVRPAEGVARPRRAPSPNRRRPVVPGGLRVRLVVAFMAVVAIALSLMLAMLPPLLEGYFARQENQSLETRTRLMHEVIRTALIDDLDLDGETPMPILQGTDPPAPSEQLLEALGTAQSGRMRNLATLVAQAHVEIVVSESPDRPDVVAYRLVLPLGNRPVSPDDLRRTETFTIHDGFWATGNVAPVRLFTVTLTDPSLRTQTIQAIVTVMLAAGLSVPPPAVASHSTRTPATARPPASVTATRSGFFACAAATRRVTTATPSVRDLPVPGGPCTSRSHSHPLSTITSRCFAVGGCGMCASTCCAAA